MNNKIGKYTEQVRTINNGIIKQNQFITKDGEVVEIHDKCVDNICMDIANYIEQLNEKDVKVGNKDYMENKKSKDEFKRYIDFNCGSFYFNFYDRYKMEAQYMTRFLYLCCFMDYDNRLILKDNKMKTLITENILIEILKISRAEAFNTKKFLIDNEFLIIKEKQIYVNEKYCKRGKIIKNKRVNKVRVFENSIKEIYEKSTAKEHKKLSLLFDLLPYLNLKWNMICKNTDEEILECVEAYTLKEMANLLGAKNITRFKKSLLSLTVNEQPVVLIQEILNKTYITINPKIYYKGTTIDELKYVIGLFDNAIK